MSRILLFLSVLLISQTFNAQDYNGFFDFTWDEEKGRLLLDIKNFGEDFLYVNSLAAGVGSNDIGLDRGQLGSDRIVRFEKVGNKVLLIQPNLTYRANSDNPAEVRAMAEAFAQSVIGGFKIEKEVGGTVTIDLSQWLLRDAHGIADRLKSTKQGNYKIDKNRSAIYLENTMSFPDNTEFEAMVTFAGIPDGREIRSVTPDAKSVTVRMHHSFVRLPDDNYTPRAFHPFSGYFNIGYNDYATPIYEEKHKKFIVRHRLEKKDPTVEISEAVEPIIYYLDPGCPEPVKSALMEGARWWNQAFEAAGYRNAFQVKVLPEGAHPLDVRYNMIQWVHRSTRGWSYGASVVDPRTGEIIKGHVSLGSLRVRQDFMIAQGIISPYGDQDDNHDPMMQVALARLRQLSAHEVGHTIGLAHNFAASFDNRASVMDYPHPIIDIKNGQVDISEVYDDKIGEWDKRTVLYGYQDFPDGTEVEKALQKIILETQEMGFRYMSDPDSRPMGSVSPEGHLWDNGDDPIAELDRISKVRRYALNRFGQATIPTGTPYSELEKILVPTYLMHRYQIEAVSKLIGGIHYNYAVKGDALDPVITKVTLENQEKAIEALLATTTPEYLMLPSDVLAMIPPPAYGYSRDRETFAGYAGLAFDPLGAAEAAVDAVFQLMLHEERLSRINLQGNESLHQYLKKITKDVFNRDSKEEMHEQLVFMTQKLLAAHLINLSIKANNLQVRAMSNYIMKDELVDLTKDGAWTNQTKWVHLDYLKRMYEESLAFPERWKMPDIKDLPPGSPIGCGHFHNKLD